MKTCKGIKNNGEGCKRTPSKGSDFCDQHSNKRINPILVIFKWLNQNGIITTVIACSLTFLGSWKLFTIQKATDQQYRYEDSALEFRPVLILKDIPKIRNAIADFYVIEDSTNTFYHGPIDVVGDLTYANQGNHIALSQGLVTALSTVESYNLREAFLLNKPDKILLHLGEPKPIYRDSSLNVEFDLEFTSFLSSQKGVFHAIHLFMNEAGVLFDVYNKILFELDPIKVVPTSIPFHAKVSRMDMINSISFEEKLPPTSHIYSMHEQERVFHYFNKATVDTVINGIEITTGRTQVYDVGANEYWEIHTIVSILPHASITNPVYCTWLDTNSNIIEDLYSKIPKLPLDFDLQKRFDLPFKVDKIPSLTQSGVTFYKHSVIDFEDRLGNKFQAHLTERLNIARHKIQWEIVDKSHR